MKPSNKWYFWDKRNFKKAQQLLVPCAIERGGIWADLGCSEGIFTAILYELLVRNSEIFAVDKNARALRTLERNVRETYPETRLHLLHADFTQALSTYFSLALVQAKADVLGGIPITGLREPVFEGFPRIINEFLTWSLEGFSYSYPPLCS